jgi:hypothetical protein
MAPAGISSGGRGQVPLRLRVGVSGHRDIGPDHPGLVRAVDEVLAVIALVQAAMAARSTQVGLTVVSSLAEGTDRMLARAILSTKNGQLEAVLPLEPGDYQDDFGSAASKDDFEHLLAEAVSVNTVEPAQSREHAYESAGQAVVDRSDVMVVVWNGQPARGRGGTAEIYEYARKRKKPLFWIRVDDHSAEVAVLPPTAAASFSALPPVAFAHLDRYNGERLPAALFTGPPPLLAHLSGTRLSAATGLVRHFTSYFVRADALAGRFQRRWFWVTRLLYALAAFAVLVVAAQILFAPSHERYAWFEFGALVCVTVLIIVARSTHWHHRWISARYLAEQIRSLVFLGLVGAAMPDVGRPSAGGPADADSESSWTERAVFEIWWSRPGYDPGDDVDAVREVLEDQWIRDQLKYHLRTSDKYARRSRLFTWAAVGLFALSAGAALLHSLGTGPDMLRPYRLWDFFSIVIPAVGAALSGYGAQRDYARHAERSTRFAANLTDASYQLGEAKNLHDIQQVALNVSRLMRGEATDWYSVVRVKDIEPP